MKTFKNEKFAIKLTKKGNLKVYRDGKPLDKCSMSFYFPAWSYFGIYWNTANANDMTLAFINLLCDNNINYERINY